MTPIDTNATRILKVMQPRTARGNDAAAHLDDPEYFAQVDRSINDEVQTPASRRTSAPRESDGFGVRLPQRSGRKQGTSKDAAGSPDRHVNQPKADPLMLYGLAGEVGRAAAATTEANPYAVTMGFLTFLSGMVGRDVYLSVGNTWHHARLNSLHVGRTGRGRKGDALSLVHRIRHAIDQNMLGTVHLGGLSTREGLALLIHDGYKEGKQSIEAIKDKRLWVVESEFANVLHQGKRDGNTLSAALRDAWDGVSIRPAVKTSRVWATEPHIALSGAITPGELVNLMQTRELTNGFANRFVIFWAERDRLVSFPNATPEQTVKDFARRAEDVIAFAKGSYPASKDTRRMSLSPKAAKLYGNLYQVELNRYEDGDLVAALLERRAPVLLRMAMLFALSDLTLTIEEHHIEASLAWVRYWALSIKFIFSELADAEHTRERLEVGRKIKTFLSEHGQCDRTRLMRDCFKGHVSAELVDEALRDLLSQSPAAIEVTERPRSDGQPGRGSKLYRILREDARVDSEYSEDRRSASPFQNSHPGEDSETRSELTHLSSPTSHVCEHGKHPATSQSSQHSQTAQISD